MNFFVKPYSKFWEKIQRSCFKLKTVLKLQSSKQNNSAYMITNIYIKPDSEKFWSSLLPEFIGLLQIIALTFELEWKAVEINVISLVKITKLYYVNSW